MKAKTEEAEEERQRIRALAARASKELIQNKNLAESQKSMISKLTTEKEKLIAEKDALAKSSASSKEVEELKEKITKIEGERASEKLQLEGATEINDKLRDRLRQFQKLIHDLKKKENDLNLQLKEALAEVEKYKLVSSPFDKAGDATDAIIHKPELPATKAAPPVESEVASRDGMLGAANEESATLSAPKTETTNESVAREKPAEKMMPAVPQGGFKFGPSETKPKEQKEAAEDKSALQSGVKVADEAATSAPPSKKRSAESNSDETEAKKRQAPDPREETGPEVTSQSAGEQAVGEGKPAESSTDLSKPSASRRMSGEKKEMSMKEKLLEKKRKLMMAIKAKEAKEAKIASGEGKEDEKTTKRPKTDEAQSSEKTESEKDDSKAPSLTAEDSKVSGEKVTETPEDDGEKAAEVVRETDLEEAVLTEGEGAGEDSKESEQVTHAETTESAPAPTFGSASFTNPFGVSTFGQSAAAAPTFGSSGSFLKGSSQGFAAFGQTSGGASSSSFGGAFLNIKPPGSSATPPQFTFGSSASITLPTPAQKSPQNSMFSAFSSGNTLFSSGGVTAIPLFGTKKNEEAGESKNETDEQEEGEIEDAEQQSDV